MLHIGFMVLHGSVYVCFSLSLIQFTVTQIKNKSIVSKRGWTQSQSSFGEKLFKGMMYFILKLTFKTGQNSCLPGNLSFSKSVKIPKGVKMTRSYAHSKSSKSDEINSTLNKYLDKLLSE